MPYESGICSIFSNYCFLFITEKKEAYECDYCSDRPFKKCKHCACSVCGGKDEPGKQILCDECNSAYHIWCLKPKLDSIPEVDDW